MTKASEQYRQYKEWSTKIGYPVRSYNSFCHIRQFFNENQIINDRPATDQDGAEEVFVSTFDGHGNFNNIDDIFDAIEQKENRDYSKHLLLEAMTTYAAMKVSEAVEAKEKEIERYFNESQKLATKHGNLYGKALAELTAAKKRIEELEDAVRWALGETDFRLHNNGEGPYWWRNELRQRANIKPQ